MPLNSKEIFEGRFESCRVDIQDYDPNGKAVGSVNVTNAISETSGWGRRLEQPLSELPSLKKLGL
ncbi:hypothetical protein MMC31_006598 [Peltigera leucophlebia]|nr:hypothetical protein [Peltigera leucophlebia]